MSPSRYRRLDAGQIVGTIRSVKGRIDRRFPGSGLGRVCGELLDVGEKAAELTASLRRPIYPIRVVSWILIGLIVLLAIGQFALRSIAHVVIGAVNEIENLTSGLTGKIWQKIMILDRMTPEA